MCVHILHYHAIISTTVLVLFITVFLTKAEEGHKPTGYICLGLDI